MKRFTLASILFFALTVPRRPEPRPTPPWKPIGPAHCFICQILGGAA